MFMLLILWTFSSISGSDTLSHEALLLRLLSQNNTNAPSVNQENNNRAESITKLIQDKQEELDDQWEECCCQAAAVETAGMIFGAILYPPVLHVSVPYSLLLGATSSTPYCGLLLCIHSYGHAKRKSELDDLIREYQQALPALRTMEE